MEFEAHDLILFMYKYVHSKATNGPSGNSAGATWGGGGAGFPRERLRGFPCNCDFTVPKTKYLKPILKNVNC